MRIARCMLQIESGLGYGAHCILKVDLYIVLDAQCLMHIEDGLRHCAVFLLGMDWCTMRSASCSVHIESGLVHDFKVQIEGGLLHGSRCTLKVDWFMVLSAHLRWTGAHCSMLIEGGLEHGA